jgi:hypothetical protein
VPKEVRKHESAAYKAISGKRAAATLIEAP